jgi:geranylgeranyl diphosphate synthase, type I
MTVTLHAISGHDLGAAAVLRGVDQRLEEFLAERTSHLDLPHLEVFTSLLRSFLHGGKRIRPLLAYAGWAAAGGTGDTAAITAVGASLEMFHACALIHDDIMDASDTRRGKPAIHRAFQHLHHAHHEPGRLGVNAAILLGDLACGWSYELLGQLPASSAIPQDRLTALRAVLDTMRCETLIGQYLDLLHTTAGPADPATLKQALSVIRYKTSKYTIERPLHAGAALAGAGPATLEACSAYALPLGEGFQLRDDLLGVFGNPASTGKPVLDDLREGKRTALVVLARQHANPAQAALLDALLGNPDLDEDGAAQIRTVLARTGARDIVEDMISDRLDRALRALQTAPFQPAARDLLRHLADGLTSRLT